jgi:hypothetical protein
VGDSTEKRGMYWKSWYKISILERKDGIGFRDFESFNAAMLGKQAWRLLENPTGLCTRVLKDFIFLRVISSRLAAQKALQEHGRL